MEHQQTWGEGSIVTTQGIVHHGIQTTRSEERRVGKECVP